MKKTRTIIIFIMFIIFCASCNKITLPTDDNLTFDEDNFFKEYMEVYANYSEYIGKELTVEGQLYISKNDSQEYCMVIRYVYGVCNVHEYEVIGFEIDMIDSMLEYENQWVKVTGILDVYYEGDDYFLIIRNPDIKVSETQGNLTVY